MQPETRREVEEWLNRAHRDLLVAERSLQGPVTLGESTAFHAQQAAEKAIKGFLTARQQVFTKTHDLDSLVRQCQTIDSSFARFLASARTLTPYVARFRYPGGPFEPPIAEAEQALQLAREIVEFVHQQLGI